MKALFIGGSGYIGRHLMKKLNYEEKVYYSRTKIKQNGYDDFQWIEGDVSEKDKLKDLIKNYDAIFYLSNSYSDNENEAKIVNVEGIKTVGTEVKRIDKNQRLVFFSSINVHYGTNTYFRTRRTGEDNAALAKNHLIVRLSPVYGGENPPFLNVIKDVLNKNIEKFPEGGYLCPAHIDDVAYTVEKSEKIIGSIYVNSGEKIKFVDCLNMIAKKTGKREIKEGSGFLDRNLSRKILEDRIMDPITLDRMLKDYYRETSSLLRFVKEPKLFSSYVDELVGKIS
ncbi:NAD-dependent epimerase/dehydratase family protein [Caldiplasma sukawensis]